MKLFVRASMLGAFLVFATTWGVARAFEPLVFGGAVALIVSAVDAEVGARVASYRFRRETERGNASRRAFARGHWEAMHVFHRRLAMLRGEPLASPSTRMEVEEAQDAGEGWRGKR